jgi:hypothetical protein
MSPRIITTLAVVLSSCQNYENSLDLYGQWIDISCTDQATNCHSRYPVIKIDPKISDTLFLKKPDGAWDHKWTNHKWESFSLMLENGYESLLYPNYKTGRLQYYDNTTERFVYYIKSSNP